MFFFLFGFQHTQHEKIVFPVDLSTCDWMTIFSSSSFIMEVQSCHDLKKMRVSSKTPQNAISWHLLFIKSTFLWTLNCYSLKRTNRYWFQWFMDWHFVPQGTKTLIFMWIFFPHQQTNSTDDFDIFSWKWATFWKIKWPCSNSRRVEIQYLSTMHHRLPSVKFSLIEK